VLGVLKAGFSSRSFRCFSATAHETSAQDVLLRLRSRKFCSLNVIRLTRYLTSKPSRLLQWTYNSENTWQSPVRYFTASSESIDTWMKSLKCNEFNFAPYFR
jgi:hypothetical protein